MTVQLSLNLAALLLSLAGTLLMFRFTPKVNSQVFIYRREELEGIRKRDAQKQAMITRGMILLLIGCLLQTVALMLPAKP